MSATEEGEKRGKGKAEGKRGKRARVEREGEGEGRGCTRAAVIDSAGQFTDGFTITIKLCPRGKLYS